jgi:hypothetical protein
MWFSGGTMMVLAHRQGPGRYVLIQAAVLLGVFVVLAVTPAPVTFPDGPWEVVLLLKGAAALLVTDLLLIGVARRQDGRSRGEVRTMDSESALEWARIGHFHVVQADRVIGVVDEVVADRSGIPRALIASEGWFGRRRFLVPLDELYAIDRDERTVTVEHR